MYVLFLFLKIYLRVSRPRRSLCVAIPSLNRDNLQLHIRIIKISANRFLYESYDVTLAKNFKLTARSLPANSDFQASHVCYSLINVIKQDLCMKAWLNSFSKIVPLTFWDCPSPRYLCVFINYIRLVYYVAKVDPF